MSTQIHAFGDPKKIEIAILIKELSFNLKEIYLTYVEPLVNQGIPLDTIAAVSLEYLDNNKCPAVMQKNCLNGTLKPLQSLGVKMLLIADPNYFKTLTKRRKVETSYGYAVPCKYKGYESFTAILTINYSALFYNPALSDKIDMSLTAVADLKTGQYADPGTGIIHTEIYPDTYDSIKLALEELHKYPTLTCDIEAFSLQIQKAGIGTIAFAWNQHEGLAFSVQHNFVDGWNAALPTGLYVLLKEFFKTYQGVLIYHGGTYDIKVLIYELFMKNAMDYAGMIEGLKIMCKDIEDTKLISYLATNTCAGNKLSLKQTAFEFAGDYAQDEIKDITQINKADLLRYNLVDCLGTWYTYNKNYPLMVRDNQEDIYRDIFLPSMKVIIQMEIVGMPINMDKVKEAEDGLLVIKQGYLDIVEKAPQIKHYNNILQTEALIDKNNKLKKKVMHASDFLHVAYNPASNNQTRHLLYDIWGYDVIDKTDSGAAAVGAGTLKKLLNQLKIEHGITDEEMQ